MHRSRIAPAPLDCLVIITFYSFLTSGVQVQLQTDHAIALNESSVFDLENPWRAIVARQGNLKFAHSTNTITGKQFCFQCDNVITNC